MKKLLLPLLFLFACQGSKILDAKSPYDNSEGDPSAEYAQSLMRNTVQIKETIVVEETSNDGSVSEQSTFWSAGSGVVVKVDKVRKTSMILTAWHVCDTYPVGYKEHGLFSTYEVVEDKQEVITTEEKRLGPIKVLYRNKSNDTCAIEVKHVFPYHATIADKMPPRGAFVDVVGAPLGTWGNHLVSVSRGQYFGLMTISIMMGLGDDEPTELENFAYYGFAGVGGYSGSAIYYKGKVVGLHTAGSTRYEHASYGPTVEDIKDTLDNAGY